ncbi:putative Glycoside hydrolase [Seiridium unicorne]|uniref:Mannan endo-1,6-alpha-mannosidase n=1 Tax=Seiridium unicorne TaxID=138068 RepID=A0ABR2VG87_9PEZI
MKTSPSLLGQLLFAVPGVLGAITVDIDNADSVKAAAALVAEDLLTFYHGDEPGNTPGIFGDSPPSGDYYWWTGSILWGTLLDLRSRTGNTTYDDTILEGLQFQVGKNDDYMPANFTASMGNDDQGFWAQAVLLAEETDFVDPPSGDPQWLALAQTVFNEQTEATRRVSDDNSCAGALRWQILPTNNGYDYVSTASNAGYFSIGAQLAFLTKNQTYSDEAAKTYDLLTKIGLVDDDFNAYDGVLAPACDSISKLQFSYDAGLLLQGSAYLYNYTNDDVWKTRLDGLLGRSLEVFFPDGIAVERACETANTCTTDMEFFKGILHRSLALVINVAPYTADKILPVLKTSAKAAASTCTGGDNGRMCGFEWSGNDTKSSTSAGAQSNVLAALVSVLATTESTSSTGSGSGNSTSSGGAGSGGSGGSASGSSNSTGGDGGSMGANVGVSFSALVGGLIVAAFVG